MPAECIPKPMRFARLKGRDLVADFRGGALTSDAGALLLGAVDRSLGLVTRFAGCFSDARAPGRTVHAVETLVGQRVFGMALGYEDLLDHDELRHDPALGPVLGQVEAHHRHGAPLAGKSTLNRLEHAPTGPHRYRRIGHDPEAIEALLVDLFLEAHAQAPKQLVLDLDATDDPLHGRQEGPLLPWLLRLLLLPAALHLLRRPSAGGEAAARQHRRQRRRGGGGGADRRAASRPLAGGGDRAARRLRLRPRRPDGLVRGQRCRLCLRSGAQRAARPTPATGAWTEPESARGKAAGRSACSPSSAIAP